MIQRLAAFVRGSSLPPPREYAPSAQGPPAIVGEDVHVVFATDPTHYDGLAAAVLSATRNSCPRVKFHVIVAPGEKRRVARLLRCSIEHANGSSTRLRTYAFDKSNVTAPIRVRAKEGAHGKLASPLNFARFYLERILSPRVRKLVYIDVDTIIWGDLCNLFDSTHKQERPPYLAAVQMGHLSTWLEPEALRMAQLDGSRPGFNAGVCVINLAGWRAAKVTSSIEYPRTHPCCCCCCCCCAAAAAAAAAAACVLVHNYVCYR